MSDQYLSAILPSVLEDMRQKSKAKIYQTDPEAWCADVLGKRWWSKQVEIADSYIHNTRTAVKSANGTGKSWLVSDLICHFVSVHEPGEALALVTAPTLGQVADVLFAYLKSNYGLSVENGTPLLGRIREDLEWKYDGPYGSQLMVKGLKPSDRDAVGSFQGRRRARTAVFLDEAGAVHPDLYTAMEAVTTGADSRIVAIGNPDNAVSEFHRLYSDEKYASDWERFTISAFDLPTFTGEKVYSDPVKQHALLNSGMTTPEWVDQKRRAWGEGSARWQSKVMGEFPDYGDNSFFPMTTINDAFNTDIPDTGFEPVILGVDVARMGQDETVIYQNCGGRIRFVDAWGKTDNVENAKRVHKRAEELGAVEVRIDAAGTGSGTFDILNNQPTNYTLIGILGANRSPDTNQWAQARSWHYDQFREGMNKGTIDLDESDGKLKDELISQTYRFSQRNALQITPKDEMKKAGLSSPDYLDAAIYSFIDTSPLTGNPYKDLSPGDVVQVDPWEYLGLVKSGAGMPF